MANKKDTILEEIGNDSSDSGHSVPQMNCDTCNLEFPSVKAYTTHVNGKKHIKKVKQEKSVTMLLKKANEKDDDDSSELYCNVCKKFFSGHVPYITHLESNGHAKHVRKQKLKEKLANMPEVLDKDDKGEGGATSGLIPKPYASCEICQKVFSGPESFNDHLKSSIHKKKIEKLNLETKISDAISEGDDLFKCKACNKSFSGPIPYQQHMSSKVHKKCLEKKKVEEEMKKIVEEYDKKKGFICKECKKAFNDPLMFKNHLANNSHEKQKAKKALKEFFSEFPEITFIATFRSYDDHDDKSKNDDSDQEFYLICKTCEMSFSGPESAQAHVKSKKHVKKQNDKLLLKSINKQKEEMNESEKQGPEYTADGEVKNDDLSGKIESDDSLEVNKSDVSSRTEVTQF